jgi:hypothetical protein
VPQGIGQVFLLGFWDGRSQSDRSVGPTGWRLPHTFQAAATKIFFKSTGVLMETATNIASPVHPAQCPLSEAKSIDDCFKLALSISKLLSSPL